MILVLNGHDHVVSTALEPVLGWEYLYCYVVLFRMSGWLCIAALPKEGGVNDHCMILPFWTSQEFPVVAGHEQMFCRTFWLK